MKSSDPSLVGWDISTVDSYDALMLPALQTPPKESSKEAEIGQTLWLTTDVARQVYFYSGSRNSEDRIWRLPGK